MPNNPSPDHPAGVGVLDPEVIDQTDLDSPWVVLVWNDPINLVSYVCATLQRVFGYPKDKAMTMTMQVHNEGRAVVANGAKEKCEMDVSRLHEHGLWATMQQDR